MKIYSQYAMVISGYGIKGIHLLLNPMIWFKIYYIGRNYTSCGDKKFGLNMKYRRLNVYPFSIWF